MRETVFDCDLEDCVVLFETESGMYYRLGSTAAAIWRLLRKRIPVDAIVETLSSEYAVTSQSCQADVEQFLRELRDISIIV